MNVHWGYVPTQQVTKGAPYMYERWLGRRWLPHPSRLRCIAVEALQVSLQLYNPSTCRVHGPRVGTHSLQRLYSSEALYSPLQPSTALYSPLQPSTALYSSTALHPLQYTTLYSTPQTSAHFCHTRQSRWIRVHTPFIPCGCASQNVHGYKYRHNMRLTYAVQM
jgi:hypothetical protein